jgi:uncharacterized protein YkwD
MTRTLAYHLVILFMLAPACVQNGVEAQDPNLLCETVDGVKACQCAQGWQDDGANGCEDLDECVDRDDACDAHASCTNLEGSFECACNDGWTGDGSACVDLDECAEQDGLCEANATCQNTDGSYTCTCNEGWQGDDSTCMDIDECATDASVCDPNAACTNTVGSFSCLCNSGWQGDGALCSDVDECQDNPCDEHALCTNTDGAYECACGDGWEGDGITCMDTDECAADGSPCDIHAECINTPGAYECICNEGWEWNGAVCFPVCGDGICLEGETCQACGEDCATYGANEDTTSLDDQEQAFLVIINEYRQQNELGTLAACHSLNRAAQGHSEDMRDQNYFAHQGLNGSSPWDRACGACYELGCGPKTAMSENIAAGNADAQNTFTQWKNSPGHNKNMLSPSVNYIGIGRATGGGQYGVYWTNVFGGAFEQSCD